MTRCQARRRSSAASAADSFLVRIWNNNKIGSDHWIIVAFSHQAWDKAKANTKRWTCGKRSARPNCCYVCAKSPNHQFAVPMTQLEGAFRASSCCSFETSGVRGEVIVVTAITKKKHLRRLKICLSHIPHWYTLNITEDCWRSLNLAEDYWTLDVIEVVDAHWSYVEAAGEKVKEGQEERRPVLKTHMSSVGYSEYPWTQDTQVQFL